MSSPRKEADAARRVTDAAALRPVAFGEVRVDAVHKAFGRQVVLSAASLHVRQGTVAALIGPNGSGKTTLLRIIAGVIEPDAGTVVVCSRPARKGLARFVPPGDRGLHWRLTARQNLRFFGRLAGLSSTDVERRLHAVASALDAESLLDKRVGACSSGERRRIALSSGFVSGAPVVLLDEPLGGLDEEGGRRLGDLARRWANAGGVVLYAAPLPEVVPVPDITLSISEGRLEAMR